MNESTQTIGEILYPIIYERITELLPEFGFKTVGNNGYVSTNGLKIDGTTGDAEGKVRIYANNIGHLIDHRGTSAREDKAGSISIWQYVKNREGIEEPGQVWQYIADQLGERLPERYRNPEAIERAERYRRIAQIWEAANDFLLSCMGDESNPIAKTAEAAAAREYLTKPKREGGRGYTATDLIFFKSGSDRSRQCIEPGFMPEPQKVYDYLKNKGYDINEARKVLRLTEDGRVGTGGYVITLPYRDSAGAIRGFVIRNIRHSTTDKANPKYLFTKSLEGVRGKLLYRLRPLTGDKGLLLVESQFDADLLSVRGIENVAAIGGVGVSEDQIKQALKMGAKSITILLDNEPKRVGDIKAAIRAIQAHDALLPIYVATIPGAGIKDPEEYVLAFGEDALKSNVLNKKQAYWKYLLYNTITEYSQQKQGDEADEVSLQNLIHTAAGIRNPTHYDLFLEEADKATSGVDGEFRLTKDALRAAADKVRSRQATQAQDKALNSLLIEARKLQAAGDIQGALTLMHSQAKGIQSKNKEVTFSHLLQPVNEHRVKAHFQNKPDNLKTGLSIQGEELEIPAGAITILAGPTSHGKTTFLINLALNATQKYNNKKFHVFSYEEDAESVLISSLNSYIGEELSKNNRETIQAYFREGTTRFFTKGEYNQFSEKKEQFFKELVEPGRYNIHYVDYNSDTLIEAIHYLHKQGDVGGVYIDYMQLLHKGERGNNKYGSRQEELKQICLDLKDAAVDTGLPIVLGAQFNREVDNHLLVRANKIGEAGDIERIANTIIGFWNNEFEPLAGEKELKEIQGKGWYTSGTLFTKVLKRRGARAGISDTLPYNGNTGRITNSPVAVKILY